jgi:hypothetical protein
MGETIKGCNMLLKNKTTGRVVEVVDGKPLKSREAKKHDITASFIIAKDVETQEEVGIVWGYTKTGEPSEKNEYIVEEDK